MAGIYFNIKTFGIGGIDEYTKLMLHMDGDLSDSSDSNHTVSTAGDPTFDSVIKKFGSSSLYFDGSGDYLSIPDSNDWYLGASDFTIDCWVYLGNGATVPIYSQLGNVSSNNHRVMFGYWGGKWNFFTSTTTTQINITVTDSAPATSEWIHVAVVRSGEDFMFFKGGTQIGTTQTDARAVPNNTGSARIGAVRIGGSFPVVINGRIDELRISKGTARWTSNFTPPSGEYTI